MGFGTHSWRGAVPYRNKAATARGSTLDSAEKKSHYYYIYEENIKSRHIQSPNFYIICGKLFYSYLRFGVTVHMGTEYEKRT